MWCKKYPLLILFILLVLLTVWFSKRVEKNSVKGMFYSGKDGTKELFIGEDSGVMGMSNYTDDDTLFDGLNDGDVIEVKADIIINANNWPYIPIYGLKVIKRGSYEDLPQNKVKEYEDKLEAERNTFKGMNYINYSITVV